MSKNRQRAYQDVSKSAPVPPDESKPVAETSPTPAEEVIQTPEEVAQEVAAPTKDFPAKFVEVDLNELNRQLGRNQPELSAVEEVVAPVVTEVVVEKAPEVVVQEPVDVIQPVVFVVPPVTEVVEPVVTPQGNPFSTTGARLAYEELNDYLRALSKRTAPTQDQGAALQAGLHRALLGAINAPAEEFNAVMEYFLSVFRKEQEGVFSARNRFRWITSMNVAPVALDNFKQLMTLFTTVADPKARGLAVRQTPWHTILNYRMIKEESRQRVMAFFGV